MGRLFVRSENDEIHVDSAPITAVPFSISLWAKVANATAEHALITILDKDVSSQFWYIAAAGHLAGAPIQCSTNAGTGVSAFTTTGFVANTWFNVVAVFPSVDERDVWLNGAGLGQEFSSRAPAGADRLMIGRFQNGPGFTGNTTEGLIAEVAIWASTLGDPHVERLSKGAHPWTIRPNTLVFYAPLIGRFTPELDLRRGTLLTVNGAVKGDHPPVKQLGSNTFGFLTPAAPSPTTPSSTTVIGGQIRIITPDGQTGYGGLTSRQTFDLTSSWFSGELVDAGAVVSSTDRETYIATVADPSNEYRLRVTGTTLQARKKIADVWTTVSSTTYNATTHYALRLREANGTVFWEYRTATGSWIVFTSEVTTLTMTNVTLVVAAGNINVTTPATVLWDNVNLDPLVATDDYMMLLGVG